MSLPEKPREEARRSFLILRVFLSEALQQFPVFEGNNDKVYHEEVEQGDCADADHAGEKKNTEEHQGVGEIGRMPHHREGPFRDEPSLGARRYFRKACQPPQPEEVPCPDMERGAEEQEERSGDPYRDREIRLEAQEIGPMGVKECGKRNPGDERHEIGKRAKPPEDFCGAVDGYPEQGHHRPDDDGYEGKEIHGLF